MLTLIEKLGITPGPWITAGNDINYIGDPDWFYRICHVSQHSKFPNNQNLIVTAPEMFLWITGMIKCADSNDMLKAAQLLELAPEIIEKATGKTSPEIKELIK